MGLFLGVLLVLQSSSPKEKMHNFAATGKLYPEEKSGHA